MVTLFFLSVNSSPSLIFSLSFNILFHSKVSEYHSKIVKIGKVWKSLVITELLTCLYTEQNYERNTFVFAPIFSWTELKDIRLVLCTQKACFSQILFTNLSVICVREHFSFGEVIQPPHRCGISRCWLDSMIIAQVCLRLAAIKGHSKMCSFTVSGGGGGVSENQSVSVVTIICLTQCNTSPSHRVDQVVDCVMLVHSSSMAVWSCWILAGRGTCCRNCIIPQNLWHLWHCAVW